MEHVDEQQIYRAQQFIKELHEFQYLLEETKAEQKRVKVAILDSGFHVDRRVWRIYRNRVKEVRSFLENEYGAREGRDEDGHGTNVATAFLQCASNRCDLYVGKVFGGRDNPMGATNSTSDAIIVSKAIRYAVEEWEVDIISMSFGFEHVMDEIDEALNYAGQHNVLLVAAASNIGGNTGRAKRWPGTRDNVLSVCATEGNGFQFKGNPPPRKNHYNFATLGVMVPVWSIPDKEGNSQWQHRSGTSIATPVAAAIAALVIEIIRRPADYYIDQHLEHQKVDVERRVQTARRAMLQASGMCRIFSVMAQDKGGYDYVHPMNMMTRYMTPFKMLDKMLDSLDG